MTIAELLAQSSQQLSAHSDSPQLDADVLLCHVLQKERSHLRAWPEKILDQEQLDAFEQLLQQRLAGKPIAYLTGHREFWSLDLKVNEDTLIPRPETELLIETLLELYPANSNIQLADLGTGSGAIALAIASERPQWSIIATDIDAASLKLAQHNAEQHQLNNIQFIQSNWFEGLGGQTFDIIISNPPYIPDTDPHLEQGDVRFEPRRALSSGHDGLDDIRLLSAQASQHLKTNGLLLLEHGYDQKQQVRQIFTENLYKNIRQALDMLNQPRLTLGYKA